MIFKTMLDHLFFEFSIMHKAMELKIMNISAKIMYQKQVSEMKFLCHRNVEGRIVDLF